jgi:hypothetical protein
MPESKRFQPASTCRGLTFVSTLNSFVQNETYN